ncbi:MAG TPA: hypothetical protein PLB88_00690 [Thermoanaerobaculaceae bacterium]|nr:MAG: hypothetical protein B7Z61_04295 [Acidobacteria bacterium 37-71-11]HQT93455.1 hypothetical protein [Thermoanaerobaculaceae bacterium]HQU32806.1 hypothetical protein [Thermoanaerobaculaceae bacterium]
MQSGASRVPLLVSAVLLVTLLFPALFLGYRVAPEASLKSFPPWRSLWGPYPSPSPEAVRAATHLGPRLATIARDGTSAAIWDPWIGGGRPGWLSAPEEGGAPLPVAAAFLARVGWTWTALVALELGAALLGTWWALRTMGLAEWPAAVGATAYALSGAAAGAWLSWRGSALALGPLALALVLAPLTGRRRVVAFAAALFILAASGGPAVAFVALAAAAVTLRPGPHGRVRAWSAALAATVIVCAVMLPRIWLDRAGWETGAAETRPQPPPPIDAWRDLVTPSLEPQGSAAWPAGANLRPEAGNPGYLGLAVLILAAVGAALAPSRERGLWLGVASASAVIAAAPSALLARAGLSHRPFGVLAVAVAALAAYGVSALIQRAPRGWPAGAVGGAAWLLVAVSMLPGAARRLPFAPGSENGLQAPIPHTVATGSDRVAGLLGTMPPDVGAAFGIADVRASSFPHEPRYASLLGAARGGDLPVSRALDPEIARLGARYLLEPLPLRIVSGEIFSRTEPADLAAEGEPGRFRATVPPGATRLGLATSTETGMRAWLESPSRSLELEPDTALRSESGEWRWFAVPAGFPSGGATLVLQGPGGAVRAAPDAAWDSSGLRLVAADERGIRLWAWDQARPFVFLATGVQAGGRKAPADPRTVTAGAASLLRFAGLAGHGTVAASVQSSRLEARVRCDRAALLVAQVKYRPALWRATVNGGVAATTRVDGVWTAIEVPAGTSRVVLEARVPVWAWAFAGGGLAVLALLSLPGRRS